MEIFVYFLQLTKEFNYFTRHDILYDLPSIAYSHNQIRT